jgi:hypothetical protein
VATPFGRISMLLLQAGVNLGGGVLTPDYWRACSSLIRSCEPLPGSGLKPNVALAGVMPLDCVADIRGEFDHKNGGHIIRSL